MRKTKSWMTIICIILSLVCIIKILGIFKINDKYSFNVYRTFPEEKNTLDAVYIGASSVVSFWQPALAWADHGITVYSYAIPNMNAVYFPYMIREIDKTQPDAVLILNLNSFKTIKYDDVVLHRMSNYMYLSPNKLDMIHNIANGAGYTGLDQLQFYFPVIRFHSRWSSLKSWDFNRSPNGLKGGMDSNSFLTRIADQSDRYKITDKERELTDIQAAFLEEFFEFLDQSGHQVIFIASPQALNSYDYQRLNRMAAIIREHGYECLNLVGEIDEINLQTDTDFMDYNHTNVHGSIKFTEYVAQYLVENYGFSDKRGQPGWESWDDAVELYMKTIAPYTLALEREHAPRDYDLQAPSLNKIQVDNQTLTLSWKESPNAEGYDIYRKSNAPNDKNWAYHTSIDSGTLQYVDSGLKSRIKYTYTVVPKKFSDGVEVYGNFDFTGVTGTAK